MVVSQRSTTLSTVRPSTPVEVLRTATKIEDDYTYSSCNIAASASANLEVGSFSGVTRSIFSSECREWMLSI